MQANNTSCGPEEPEGERLLRREKSAGVDLRGPQGAARGQGGEGVPGRPQYGERPKRTVGEEGPVGGVDPPPNLPPPMTVRLSRCWNYKKKTSKSLWGNFVRWSFPSV